MHKNMRNQNPSQAEVKVVEYKEEKVEEEEKDDKGGAPEK